MNMGKTQRTKGKRVELEIVHIFKRFDFDAQRIPLSGATQFKKGDVLVRNDKHEFTFEVKARKNVTRRLLSVIEAIEAGNVVTMIGKNGEYLADSLENFAYQLQVYDEFPHGDYYLKVLPCPSEIERWYNFDGLIIKLNHHQPIIVIKQ